MATNAASALEWFNNSNPDRQQLSSVLVKLEERINNESNGKSDLSGTLEALELLQELYIKHFEESEPAVDTTNYNLSQNTDINLDVSSLGNEVDMLSESLSEQERKARFNKLKKQLNAK